MESSNEWTYFTQIPQYCEWRKWDDVITWGIKRDLKDNKEQIICMKKFLRDSYVGGNNTYIYLLDTTKIKYEENLEYYYHLHNKVLISENFRTIPFKNNKDLITTLFEQIFTNEKGCELISHYIRNICNQYFHIFEDGRVYEAIISEYIRNKDELACPCCRIMGNIGARGYVGHGHPDNKLDFSVFLTKISNKYKL